MPDTSAFGLLDPLSQGTRALELTSDAAWLQAMVDVELALTRSCISAGIAPEWMAEVCDQLEDASRLDLAAIAAGSRGGGNPVIPLVPRLGKAADDLRSGASDYIHIGSTSQDIIDTAAMVIARQVIDEASAQLTALAGALATLADQHRATAMVGRTLGQHAAPTTFGFVVAGWLDAVISASTGLDRVRSQLPVQVGGAVGTSSVLTQLATTRRPDAAPYEVVDSVIAGVSARLGLTSPAISWHTNRLPILELSSALSAAVAVVGAFALDITVLSRSEIAEVSERVGQGEGGSSAMPHKRNPVTAVLITAAARRAPGLLATLHASALAEDQRPSGAWHAEWESLRDLERVTISSATAAAQLASRLEVDEQRMLDNLSITNGLVLSESLAALVAEELGASAAKDIVGRAAVQTATTGNALPKVLSELLPPDTSAALRSKVGAATESGVAGLADAGIDRVLQRHRELTVRNDTQ